jgi:filamentous hemagglutinin family protein
MTITALKQLNILCWINFCLLSGLSTVTNAEIITDGTLGNRVNLPGKAYQITESLGTRIGNNLFHSFEKFDLQAGEIATFSGDAGLENIFGRVTNGMVSHINGTIHSTIPEVAIFLLNPAGFIFGAQAQLDLQGTLVVTTGDTIDFKDKGVFFVDPQRNSLLTVAEPQAFGFITETPALSICNKVILHCLIINSSCYWEAILSLMTVIFPPPRIHYHKRIL